MEKQGMMIRAAISSMTDTIMTTTIRILIATEETLVV